MAEAPRTRVALVGGPLDGSWGYLDVDATDPPRRLRVGDTGPVYERIDDPDTGAWLGGYACVLRGSR